MTGNYGWRSYLPANLITGLFNWFSTYSLSILGYPFQVPCIILYAIIRPLYSSSYLNDRFCGKYVQINHVLFGRRCKLVFYMQLAGQSVSVSA